VTARARALLVVLLIVGCDARPGADGDAATTDPDAQPAADARAEPGCEGSLDPLICSGALDPTELGDGIDLVETGILGGAPGAYWWCAPGDGVPWNGRLVIHLVGTYADPLEEHGLPQRACELGLAAIAPMYENRDAGRAVCGDDPDCYEAFHAEIVDGEPGAPDPVDVSTTSALRHRIATLLDRLAARGAPWIAIRDALVAGDFSAAVISGHSQGAGHALYLARDESAERVILLAGPTDRTSSGTASNAPAPWISALEASPLPTARRFGYIHDDDGFAVVDQVVDNWRLAGVVGDDSCAFRSGGGYDPTCRGIRTATDGCTDLAAHLTPILSRWGPRCGPGSGELENRATWDHLLLAE
jgi:hypothetical protein